MAEASTRDEEAAPAEAAAVERAVAAQVVAGTGSGAGSSAGQASAGQAAVDIVSQDELYSAFREARLDFQRVEDSELPGGDAGLQAQCAKCKAAMAACDLAVRRLGVFGKDETAEDVNTEDLPFVLVNYYAGKLALKTAPGGDPSGATRLKAVREARQLLAAFLERCDVLQLLDAEDKASFAGLLQQQAGAGAPPLALTRQAKMERFKKSRDAKKRLQEVAARIKFMKERQAADEDLERERELLDIDCAIKNALDEVDATNQEEQILEHMAKMSLEFTGRDAPAPAPPKTEGLTVTRIDKGLNMTRETVKSEVFRPSWRQPTMSLEEFAEREREEALERGRREKEHMEQNPEVLSAEELLAQGLEDDEKLMDKATKKDRDWDDWKDDNPKGRGVTKRF